MFFFFYKLSNKMSYYLLFFIIISNCTPWPDFLTFMFFYHSFGFRMEYCHNIWDLNVIRLCLFSCFVCKCSCCFEFKKKNIDIHLKLYYGLGWEPKIFCNKINIVMETFNLLLYTSNLAWILILNYYKTFNSA